MEILGEPPVPAIETAGERTDVLRRRGFAAIADLLFCYFVVEGIPLALVIEYVPGWSEQYGGVLALLSVVFFLPVYLTYCFYFEWRHGRTVGKALFSLCVAHEDGSPPTLRSAAIRNLLRYVDLLPFVPPYLVGLAAVFRSEKGQRIGDRVADTIVARPRRAIDPEFAQKRKGETAQ